GLVHLYSLAAHVLLAQHVKDAVGLQDRKHFFMRVDRERRAFAHRQQACDRIDFAVGQDDARYRRVAKLSLGRMKPWCRDQLLAHVGRCIDEIPVRVISADRNRSLGALLRPVTSRGLANRTSAIPLRNTATCRGAQDDDAKHDPSPGDCKARFQSFRIPKASKVDTGMVTNPRSGSWSRLEVHLSQT